MKILCILIFLMSSCFADTVNFKVGRGILSSNNSTLYTFSHQKELFWIFQQQIEMGLYTNKAAGLASYSLGLRLESDSCYIEGLSGAGLISNTDSMLGSHFQFFHDVGVGLRNSGDFSIGLGYKHISNADIKMPNYGKDYLYLKLGIPIF